MTSKCNLWTLIGLWTGKKSKTKMTSWGDNWEIFNVEYISDVSVSMLNLLSVITILRSFRRMSLFLGNGYWSSGGCGEMCHGIHTFQLSVKRKWKVCVCVWVQVVILLVFQMFQDEKLKGKYLVQRAVPPQLSGRKRRRNAAGVLIG